METPKHIAIVMDGNGRWANKRLLPRVAGHKAGVEAIRSVVKTASDLGVEVLSLFAFSTENWKRPKLEVKALMTLLLNALKKEVKKLHERNVKLIMIGDPSAFSEKIQASIKAAQELTANNTGLKLVIAANYGGRWDICQATKQLVAKAEQGKLKAEQVTDELLQQHLSTGNLVEPDLYIRTSGELRISNFFLWQFAYTEFYFTDTLWPDFDGDSLKQAIKAFSERDRRYGLAEEITSK
jgi:undecaprenyl diphosphate synthase